MQHKVNFKKFAQGTLPYTTRKSLRSAQLTHSQVKDTLDAEISHREKLELDEMAELK